MKATKQHFWVLSFLILFLANACAEQKLEEDHVIYSMSDTMYSRCEFSVATETMVKNEIRLFGKIEADNNKVAEVHSTVSGIVKSIHVGLGDYVQQGQILASMQSIEVASFQKEKLDAINSVTISEKTLQVVRDLFAGKLNSERDVALAEKELENARAELNRIEEIHKIYNLKGGSQFDIITPISGFIITKKIVTNELLRSDDMDAIFSIADTKDMWAVAYVSESDISKIAEGQNIAVKTLAFPDITYQSKIEKIYNVIDPQTKSIKIRGVINNDNLQLKPDMNCTVTVSYPEDKRMVTIPTSSVIFDKSKYWVMIFKDRHNIETRKIEIYRQLGDITYVKNGITDGETVISKNGLLIYDAIND